MTLSRAFTDTFAGISPGSVGPFIAMQLLGAAAATAAVSFLYPGIEKVAAEVVIPSERPLAKGER